MKQDGADLHFKTIMGTENGALIQVIEADGDDSAIASPVLPDKAVEHEDTVNHPDHYKEGGFEAIDVINAYAHIRGSFALGNAVKYILRAGKKNPKTYTEDLKKAIWYLQSEVDWVEKHNKE